VLAPFYNPQTSWANSGAGQLYRPADQQQSQLQSFDPFAQSLLSWNPLAQQLGLGFNRPPVSIDALRTLGISSLVNSDIIESPNDFHIMCEMPGVPADSVSVTIQGNFITISAKRENYQQFQDDSSFYHQRECVAGKVERSFKIPEGVNPDKATASVEHGVLMVSLPKVHPDKTSKGKRNIVITTDHKEKGGVQKKN